MQPLLPLGIFTSEQIAELVKAIEEVNAHGGWGTVTVTFQKGSVRFVEWSVSRQLSLKATSPNSKPG